jgi:hypothetical protein
VTADDCGLLAMNKYQAHNCARADIRKSLNAVATVARDVQQTRPAAGAVVGAMVLAVPVVRWWRLLSKTLA